jgi:hypothetical protein
MKARLLIFCIFYPLLLCSQIRISGTVFDKETQEPVPNVVISTDKNRFTITDDKGYYELEAHLLETVYFRQLAYELWETSIDSLSKKSDVYLFRDLIELNEITISPHHAQNLVDKAIQNLVSRYQTKKSLTYLFHIEGATSIGGEREAYALIEVILSKVNKKRGTFDWRFNLIRLDKIKTINEGDFYIKRKPVWAELFPQEISINQRLNDYVCELQNINEEQFEIKISPKQLDKKKYAYLFCTINKQDTTLIEIVSQSYTSVSELTIQKVKGINWQLTNHFNKIKFVQDEKSGFYYIEEMTHLGTSKVGDTSPYNVSFIETVSVLKDASNNPISIRKKIKPRDYVLFESDFPNSPGFWKQYIK